MISEKSIKHIAQLFCGDETEGCAYKTGPQLVSFFNNHFDYSDVYGRGFPSRWAYVYDKIVDLYNNGRINRFFKIILGKQFLMQDLAITEVAAIEKSQELFGRINQILNSDQYMLTKQGDNYYLIEMSTDLILIGSGGFANVYRQKSTGLVVKKLKDDYVADAGIRSRFKREYNITKSLQDVFGIINVFSFNESSCMYTMEYAETTLENYVTNNILTDDIRLNCIRQILYIMSEVHRRNILHRDISPNNIFIISGQIKIADFGLGKDLNVFTSHQTVHTNSVGQYYYCAPEQFMMLREADKRSDVYSIGRVINFIMTGDPRDSHHIYRSVAEKATNTDSAYRYGDAIQLSSFFEKSVQYHSQQLNKKRLKEKIAHDIYDFDVENYLYDMAPTEISKTILNKQKGFDNSLLVFMNNSEEQGQYIIQSIDQTYREVCGRSFDSYDPFASFAEKVLRGEYSFVIKETAANILRCVAWDINRFYAQHLVEGLLDDGIEPLLEDIIRA